jgi:hypothetical protein
LGGSRAAPGAIDALLDLLVARTAAGAGAAGLTHLVDRTGAILDGGVDVSGGGCVAKADVHGGCDLGVENTFQRRTAQLENRYQTRVVKIAS